MTVHLATDVSGVAVPGCLYQLDCDDEDKVLANGNGEKPIAFFSAKLSPVQTAWSVIDSEAYAVIASLKKFHNIIFGGRIIIFCDHNPLSYLVESATKSAKLTRWSLALQQYDISFRYIKAANNIVADCLSRFV